MDYFAIFCRFKNENLNNNLIDIDEETLLKVASTYANNYYSSSDKNNLLEFDGVSKQEFVDLICSTFKQNLQDNPETDSRKVECGLSNYGVEYYKDKSDKEILNDLIDIIGMSNSYILIQNSFDDFKLIKYKKNYNLDNVKNGWWTAKPFWRDEQKDRNGFSNIFSVTNLIKKSIETAKKINKELICCKSFDLIHDKKTNDLKLRIGSIFPNFSKNEVVDFSFYGDVNEEYVKKDYSVLYNNQNSDSNKNSKKHPSKGRRPFKKKKCNNICLPEEFQDKQYDEILNRISYLSLNDDMDYEYDENHNDLDDQIYEVEDYINEKIYNEKLFNKYKFKFCKTKIYRCKIKRSLIKTDFVFKHFVVRLKKHF